MLPRKLFRMFGSHANVMGYLANNDYTLAWPFFVIVRLLSLHMAVLLNLSVLDNTGYSYREPLLRVYSESERSRPIIRSQELSEFVILTDIKS